MDNGTWGGLCTVEFDAGQIRRVLPVFNDAAARAVVLLTVVVLLPFLAWYALSCWRGRDQRTDTAADHEVNFQELLPAGCAGGR